MACVDASVDKSAAVPHQNHWHHPHTQPSAVSEGKVVLGIDPGTIHVGWVVLLHTSCQAGMPSLQAYGRISAPASAPLACRLATIYTDMQNVMTQHKPHVVTMEQAFVAKNPASALALGHGRGVCLAVAGLHGLPVYAFSPATVKKTLTGTGRATKKQMVDMMQRLFGVIVSEDTADAAAVALCWHRGLMASAAGS